jgi:hypothetical protein
VQAHREKLPQMAVYAYPAGHAFNRDVDPHAWDEASARLALQRTLDFFSRHWLEPAVMNSNSTNGWRRRQPVRRRRPALAGAADGRRALAVAGAGAARGRCQRVDRPGRQPATPAAGRGEPGLRLLREEAGVDKLNIGALGNIVRQLHVHLVGRHEGDAAWPGPVWGSGPMQRFEPDSAGSPCRGMATAASIGAHPLAHDDRTMKSNLIAPLILILLGLFFLASNLGWTDASLGR